jgi:hypothetical protein
LVVLPCLPLLLGPFLLCMFAEQREGENYWDDKFLTHPTCSTINSCFHVHRHIANSRTG